MTISNQHIQDINWKLDGTTNHFGNMVFKDHQEQDDTYTLKDMS